MTREEIVRMAREAGGTLSSFDRWSMYTSDIARFALSPQQNGRSVPKCARRQQQRGHNISTMKAALTVPKQLGQGVNHDTV